MTSQLSDWLPTDGPIQTRSSLYGVFLMFRVCLHLTSTFILIPGDWTISLNYLFLCNYVARNAHDRQAGLNIALCIDFWLIVSCFQRVAFLVSYMTMIKHYYHWLVSIDISNTMTYPFVAIWKFLVTIPLWFYQKNSWYTISWLSFLVDPQN